MATPLEEQKYPITKLPTTSPVDAPKTYADLFALFNAFRKLVADIVSSLTDYLKDAPSDGLIYGRQDAEWVEVPGGGDVDWGDIGGTLTDQTDLATALSGKEPTITAGTIADYWRGDKTWQPFPSIPAAQVNSDWTAVSGLAEILNKPTIIPEAPIDGNQYARQDGAWEVVAGVTPTGFTTYEVLARNISPSASGGATAFAVAATGAGLPDIHSVAFNAATIQYAQFSVTLPPELLVPGDLRYYLRWSHPAATSFGVVWGIQAVAIGNATAVGTAYGTAVETTDLGGTTNNLYITDLSDPITIAGTVATDKPVFFRVYRNATSGADTLNVNGRLHSILLTNEVIPPPPAGTTSWNPADKGLAVSLSMSNLAADAPSNTDCCVRSIFSATTGKWYWEVELTGVGTTTMVGVATSAAGLTTYPGADAFAWAWYPFTGQMYNNGSPTSYGAGAMASGDVLSVLLDMTAGTMEYYFNGVPQGTAVTGLTGTIYAIIGNGGTSPSGGIANFGASAFVYTVPSGYYPGFG